MKHIDAFLNKITMYRLLVYGLSILSLYGIFLASTGAISLDASNLAISLGLLTAACYLSESILSNVWKTPFNKESWLITALIIFLILKPPATEKEAIITLMAGVVATASKYIIAFRGKHIFNPAAFAAAYMSLTTLQTTTWWVGNTKMWFVTVIIGLLIVRKVRKASMVVVFLGVAIALQTFLIINNHQSLGKSIDNFIISSPLLFLSSIMLTEPATMPPRKNQQIIFAVLIAVLYIEGWKLGPLYIYPEVAILIGNLYAFAVSPKLKVRMVLQEIQKISDQVYNYVFLPEKRFAFIPGQYMEWTLPAVSFDNRGNRRTFTIASSPTEPTVQLGVKFYNPSSTFKYSLSRLKPGDNIYASQLAGNFTLNGNEGTKLAFIAGGIGITPFRSMVKYLSDSQINCDVKLLYIVSKPEELAYKPEFLAAKAIGVQLIPVLSDPSTKIPGMVNSGLNQKLITAAIPDYSERIFYISGPDAMVSSAKQILKSLSVKSIKTDYFSGY